MADRRQEVAGGADGYRHQQGVGVQAQFWARLAAIGAMTSTVAALFRKGVSSMAASSMSDSALGRQGRRQAGEAARYQVGSAGALDGVADRDQRSEHDEDRPVDRLVGFAQREVAGYTMITAAAKKPTATVTTSSEISRIAIIRIGTARLNRRGLSKARLR